MIKYIKGDLIKLAKRGAFDIIIHGCNCFNTMGAGIARQIKEIFPMAYKADCRTEMGNISKLGGYTECEVKIPKKQTRLKIINAYTQYDFHGNNEFNYEALETFLKTLIPLDYSVKIGIPKIGAGLAGGDWKRIESIFNRVVPYLNITCVEYVK